MSGANDAIALNIVLAGGLVVRRGGLVLAGDTLGGRRAEIVFARLALDAGSPVSREALAEAIWGEATPSSWRPALRNVVAAIRRALRTHDLERSAALESSDGGYRLLLADGAAVDLLTLDGDAARVEEAVRAGEVERALRLATNALAATSTPAPPLRWEIGAAPSGTHCRSRAPPTSRASMRT
jgi:DNA-binding SARP family transcriptional activator